MVNNASRAGGKHWGESQFRFPYDKWKLRGGEFTYCLSQDSGECWQAAVFRESGPSVYWLRYKPPYLCDTRPGGSNPQPFYEASCWKIDNRPNSAPLFSPISAVINWLEIEWRNAAEPFAESLAGQGINNLIIEIILKAYSESLAEWLGALNNDAAQRALKALFTCFRMKNRYPYGTAQYEASEPKKWVENPNTAKAVSTMLGLHALLKIGAARSNIAFTVAPLPARHALLAGIVSATYLWGGGEILHIKWRRTTMPIYSLPKIAPQLGAFLLC